MAMKTVKFLGVVCTVYFGFYASTKNTSIQLFTLDGEPMATASVNMGKPLPQDQAYIKDYSENTGILEVLKRAGIVQRIIRVEPTGFVSVSLCQINLDWGK